MPNILKGVTQYEKHRVTPHQTQFSKHQRGYLEAIKICCATECKPQSSFKLQIILN